MKFEHPLHVRPALVTVALTLAVSAVAAATIAPAPFGTSPTGGDAKQDGGRVAVVRRPVAKFRGRYQLNLTEARRLVA
jgi:hypothetical protein